jgi:hypothetical protein
VSLWSRLDPLPCIFVGYVVVSYIPLIVNCSAHGDDVDIGPRFIMQGHGLTISSYFCAIFTQRITDRLENLRRRLAGNILAIVECRDNIQIGKSLQGGKTWNRARGKDLDDLEVLGQKLFGAISPRVRGFTMIPIEIYRIIEC